MGNADGWVTIGTKLDSKQLEKDLKNEQSKLEKFEKDVEKLTQQKIDIEAKIQIDEDAYRKKIKALNEKYDAEIKANTRFGQVDASAQQKIDLKYDQLRQSLDIAHEKSYDIQAQKLEKINKKMQENAHNQRLVKNEIEETTAKLKQARGFDSFKGSVEDIGNSIQKVTKKVGHWALALFGIRSIYGILSNSASILSSRNEQLATDMEYIRFALASTLQPVIEKLIQLAYKLLTYVAYIAKAWFGVNIFANATTKAFEKQNKALGGSVKKAKQLQKTLTGFDEMNVLQDSGDVSSGGGGGGISLPSADLSSIAENLDNIQIPKGLEWLANNKDLVIDAIMEIGAVLVGIKIAEFLKNLGLLGEGFSKFKTLLLGLGIGLIIYGIYETITSIVKFIKDPSWENFAGILKGLSAILLGVALAMLAVNAANPVAWIMVAIAAVVLLASVIIKHWDQIKEVLGKVGSWIWEKVIKPVGNFFKEEGARIKETFKNTIDDVKNKFSSMVSFFKNLISKIISLFKTIGTSVGNVIGSAFKGVVNGVLKAIESILNTPIRAINRLIGVINKVPGINLGKLSTFSLPRLAKGGIINNPGSGVMIGSAIGGERGQEGVIPLTDSQQMALLGEAIGKYITVNAQMNNYMNGRLISRELQKVQNDSNFAYNR